MADEESIEARWVTLSELIELGQKAPGLRGEELLEWGSYIEKGGYIAPLSFFGDEGAEAPNPNNSKFL